jgi:Domain of unknown function (DUF3806)
MTLQAAVATMLLGAALTATALGQNRTGPSVPKFRELSADDVARLDRQRAVVLAAAKEHCGAELTRTKKDLPTLQKLIDDAVFKKSQTYELQSLGVAFGDVMASELPLHWAIITDEFGSDPTLRFKNTTINVNALTMISKRVERDERVDLARLLRITRQQLARYDRRHNSE